MKVSYIDKCRYRKQYWNEHTYYPVLLVVFNVLILFSIVVNRYMSDYADMVFALLYGAGISLIVFCVGKLRDEYKKTQVFNVVTLGYACLFPVAAFLVHYLLTY